MVFWRFANAGQDLSHYRVPGVTRASHWLSPSAAPEWRAGRWSWVLFSRAVLTTGDARISPAAAPDPGYRVRAILADWLAPLSWDHASINRNAGDSPRALTQPVPVIAALLGLSLCCYAVLVRTRPRIPFDWGIVAGVFLVGG